MSRALREPNQRRHAPGILVPAVGKEAIRLAHRAVAAARDGGDSLASQSVACEGIQIREPFFFAVRREPFFYAIRREACAAAQWREAGRRGGIRPAEGIDDVAAHFELL